MVNSHIQLKNTIQKYIDINEHDFNLFASLFKETTIRKKQVLVAKNEIAHHAYFVIKGSVRFFYIENGIEITGNIFTENMFATSHDSFLLQTPSLYTVETIEETKALGFSYQDMIELIIKLPIIQELISKVLIRRLTLAHKTIARLITLSPEQRYLTILKENPEWIQRIPQHIIASYMGISATSLSRIRKRTSHL